MRLNERDSGSTYFGIGLGRGSGCSGLYGSADDSGYSVPATAVRIVTINS